MARKRRQFERVSAALIAGAAGGCAAPAREAQPVADAPAAALVEPPPPFTLGGDEGLEIRRLISAMTPGQLRAGFSGAVEPAPLSEAMRTRLARAGFALLRTRRGALQAALADVEGVRRVERVWIGQSPQWREMIASERRVALVRVGERAVDLSRDRPRLLLRAWAAPGEEGREVRLDLAITDGAAPRGPLIAGLDEAAAPAPAISPLAGAYVSLALEPEWAYLLVIDEPVAESAAAAPTDGPSAAGEEAGSPTPLNLFGAPPPADTVGPPAPPTLTPAQALLTSTSRDGGDATCMVLVFVAHVDANWSGLR